MSNFEQIISQDGKVSLRIVAEDDGTYILERYELRLDEDEGVTYWNRCLPNPGGRYANLALARKEASALF